MCESSNMVRDFFFLLMDQSGRFGGFFFNFLKNKFIYFIYFLNFWLRWVFVAARGLSLVVAHGLLIAVASLVVEHRL